MKQFLAVATLYALLVAGTTDLLAQSAGSRREDRRHAEQRFVSDHGYMGRVRWDDSLGVARTLLGFRIPGGSGDPEGIARSFLSSNREMFGFGSPGDALVLRHSSWTTDGGFHYYFEQVHKGIPVFNSGYVVAVKNRSMAPKDEYIPGVTPRPEIATMSPQSDTPNLTGEKDVYFVGGVSYPEISLRQEQPALTRDDAFEIAREGQSVIKERPVRLVVLPIAQGKGWRYELAYEMTLRSGSESWHYMVDAVDGQIHRKDRVRPEVQALKYSIEVGDGTESTIPISESVVGIDLVPSSGYVYNTNPVDDPQLRLLDLPETYDGTRLDNPFFTAINDDGRD